MDNDVIRFVNEYNSKVDLVNELHSKLSNNGFDLDFSMSDESFLVKITEIGDIDNINVEDVPIIRNPIYY